MKLCIRTMLIAIAVAGAVALDVTSAAALTTEEAGLLAAEDARFAAQVSKDVKQIEQSLADDLIYTHAVGRVQTKAQYVEQLAAGRIGYQSIVPTDRTVRVSGDLGVTHATLSNVVGGRTLKSSYLATYVKQGGRWQLLYWQTSPEFTPNANPPGSSPSQATPAK